MENFNRELMGNTAEISSDNSTTEPKSRARKHDLHPLIEEKVKNEISAYNAAAATEIMAANGISLTKQTEILMRNSKVEEESIRAIAWDQDRLMYATALLEHTLAGENKNISSVENLIKNYIIFSRIFEDKEGKRLRFGQFAYVMRNIFGGIKTIEEIDERIKNHKTFGESLAGKNRQKIDAFREQIDKASGDIDERLRKAWTRRKEIDGTLNEARQNEEKRKGSTWTTSYCPPKEYAFPHYTFQTGRMKGLSSARGRSSWEPMFLACADVVNKGLEDKIMTRTDLTEEEKRQRIARRRIELVYEQFDFPIDIKKCEDGKEKMVIYRLDFIDVNRWKAIEIKGPLTPEAAEKIRLFQKYYVDGDFSDLPEDKQMIMMGCVLEKMEEVKKWCEERGYPSQDHFTSLDVLGMYRWDQDINNFNRFASAGDMPGLSEKEKERLQTGFIKMVENRIKSGKMPNIRPEGYVESDKLPEVVKINEKTAKVKGEKYKVEKAASTRPFVPEIIAKEILTEVEEFDAGKQANYIYIIKEKLLDTLPISEEKKNIFKVLDKIEGIMILFYNALNSKEFNTNYDAIRDGRKSMRIKRSYVSKDDLKSLVEALNTFRKYLLDLAEKKTNVGNDEFAPTNFSRLMKNMASTIDNLKWTNDDFLVIDGNYIKQLENRYGCPTEAKPGDMYDFYRGYLLGKHKTTFQKREFILSGLINERLDSLKQGRVTHADRLLNKIASGEHVSLDFADSAITSIISQVLEKHDLPFSLSAMIRIANNHTFDGSNMNDMLNFIKIKHKNIDSAARYFSSQDSSRNPEQYATVLRRLELASNLGELSDNRNSFWQYIKDNMETITSMARIILTDQVEKEKLAHIEIDIEKALQDFSQKVKLASAKQKNNSII